MLNDLGCLAVVSLKVGGYEFDCPACGVHNDVPLEGLPVHRAGFSYTGHVLKEAFCANCEARFRVMARVPGLSFVAESELMEMSQEEIDAVVKEQGLMWGLYDWPLEQRKAIALRLIRESGGNEHPTAQWMQALAAWALEEPGKFPFPRKNA